jgi:hypothetical protein
MELYYHSPYVLCREAQFITAISTRFNRLIPTNGNIKRINLLFCLFYGKKIKTPLFERSHFLNSARRQASQTEFISFFSSVLPRNAA